MNSIKPKVETNILSYWPPVVHGNYKKAKIALCGATLQGIELPVSCITCEKCLEIAKNEYGA